MLKSCNTCKKSKGGLFPYCKTRHRAKSKHWYEANKERVREYNRSNYKKLPKKFLTKYWPGLSEAECLNNYNQLFQAQAGCCAICGKHQSQLKVSLAVDHDHDTGLIRGLLCSNCNPGLGYFKDDLNLLEKAIKYLKAQKQLRVVND